MTSQWHGGPQGPAGSSAQDSKFFLSVLSFSLTASELQITLGRVIKPAGGEAVLDPCLIPGPGCSVARGP